MFSLTWIWNTALCFLYRNQIFEYLCNFLETTVIIYLDKAFHSIQFYTADKRRKFEWNVFLPGRRISNFPHDRGGHGHSFSGQFVCGDEELRWRVATAGWREYLFACTTRLPASEFRKCRQQRLLNCYQILYNKRFVEVLFIKNIFWVRVLKG